MYGVLIWYEVDAWVWHAEEIGGSHTLVGTIPHDGALRESLDYRVVPFQGGFYFAEVHHELGYKWGRLYKVDVAQQLTTRIVDINLETLSNIRFSVGCSADGHKVRTFFWDRDSTEGLRVTSEDGENFTTAAMHFPAGTYAVSQRHTGTYLASVMGEEDIRTSEDGVLWAVKQGLYSFSDDSEAYTETVLYIGYSYDGAGLLNLDTGEVEGGPYAADPNRKPRITLDGSVLLSIRNGEPSGKLVYAAGTSYSIVEANRGNVLRNVADAPFVGGPGLGTYVLNRDGSVGFLVSDPGYKLLTSLGATPVTSLFWTALRGTTERP